MRLIDADVLKERLIPLWNCNSDSDFANKDVWRELEKAQTIDAVQVVRCKDCRFFKPWDNGDYGKCKAGYAVMADMFCSCGSRADGERKDDGK